MLLTGEAIKFAEGFAETEAKSLKKFKASTGKDFEPPELTELDQKGLLGITLMFERDSVFRDYISKCFLTYGRAYLADTLAELMLMIETIQDVVERGSK